MTEIPAGKFWRGCQPGEQRSCTKDVDALREIHVDAFAIQTDETSIADYRKCIDAGVCSPPMVEESTYCDWTTAAADAGVRCVSWEQAMTYCCWLGMRLATDAEWEKAMRGHDADAFTANSRSGTDVSDYGVLNGETGAEWTMDLYLVDAALRDPDANPAGPATNRDGAHSVRGNSPNENDPLYERWRAKDTNHDVGLAAPGIRCVADR